MEICGETIVVGSVRTTASGIDRGIIRAICPVKEALAICVGSECLLRAHYVLWRTGLASRACCVCSDGTWIAVGTQAGIEILRAEDGLVIDTRQSAAVLAMDHVRTKIATAHADGTLVMWSINASGRLGKSRELTGVYANTNAFVSEGTGLVSEDMMRLIDYAADDVPALQACAFSPGGKWLAAGGEGGELMMFEISGCTTKIAAAHMVAAMSGCGIVAITWVNERRLITMDSSGAVREVTDSGASTMLATATAKPGVLLGMHEQRWLVIVSVDAIRIFDLVSSQVNSSVSGSHRVGIRAACVISSRDRLVVHTGGVDFRIATWSVGHFQEVDVAICGAPRFGLDLHVSRCCFEADAVAILDASGTTCAVWRYETRAVTRLGAVTADATGSKRLTSSFQAIALMKCDDDLWFLATGDNEGCVAVWDLLGHASDQLVSGWRYHQPSSIVALQFSDQDNVFSADIAGDICIVAWRSGRLKRRISAAHSGTTVPVARWNYVQVCERDAIWCLVAFIDTAVVAFDPHLNKLETVIDTRNEGPITCLTIIEQQQPGLVIAYSIDTNVFVRRNATSCRLDTGQEIKVTSLSGRQDCLIASFEATLVVWMANHESYIRTACILIEGTPMIRASSIRKDGLVALTRSGWLISVQLDTGQRCT